MYFLCADLLSLSDGTIEQTNSRVEGNSYGDNESEPAAEACAQLTQEFFSEDTFRLLVICLPKLDLEVSMENHPLIDFLYSRH